MKLKHFYIILLTTLSGFAQQDVQFTQYIYNMSVINPAYTGTKETLSIGMMGRSQWTGLDGAPRSISASVNSPITNRMGLGITILSDRIGPVKEENLYADYSYKIDISDKGKLSFGIKAGVTFQKIDFLSLSSDMEGDPLVDRSNLNETYPNFGAGTYYYTNKFYVGFSIPSIIESRHFEKTNGYISSASEELHYYISSGYVFDLSNDIKFRPSTLLKGTVGAPISIDIAANFLFYEKFELGVAYRINNSVAGMMNFVIAKDMRLGYSYEHTISNYSAFNSGTHEVFFLYDMPFKGNDSKPIRFF